MSLVVIALLLSGCAHQFGLRYPPARWVTDDDALPIAQPAKPTPFLYPNDAPPAYMQDVEMLFELTARVAELPSNALPGGRVEALDVDNFDEAPDSSWFTNRIGRRDLTDAELVRGPGEVDLARAGPLEITTMGHSGVVLWMAARGQGGDDVLLTFDLADHPEMATGAGFIVSRILFAAGYNTPACSLVEIDPQRFTLAPSATFRNISGETKPASAADLEALLKGAARTIPKGQLRALATARPAGVHLGPFSFKGRRRHDANDRIAHQHRRELRGLDPLAAWLDLRLAIGSHTADLFVAGPDGQGHVVHHLFAFEAALGNFDWAKAAFALPAHPSMRLKPVSLGLPSVTFYTNRPSEAAEEASPRFDAVHLTPARWEPAFPNPAMWIGTQRDQLWGSILLSKFTDARLAAIVGAARFSSAPVRSQLLFALAGRRDKLMGFWFGRINPVGDFRAQRAGDGTVISFADYAADADLPGTQGSRYRWRLRTVGARVVLSDWRNVPEPRVTIGQELIERMGGRTICSLQLQTLRPGEQWPSPSVEVLLKRDDTGTIALQGIRRRTNN